MFTVHLVEQSAFAIHSAIQSIEIEKKRWALIVASTNADPIADSCTLGALQDKHAFLSALYVNEPHRGKGLGAAIIKAAIELARAENKRAVSLIVSPKNHLAIKLYTRLGFKSFYDDSNGTWMSFSLV
jgi:ribosomal protein S18 acetylase RimI-like enzyme